MTPMIPTANKLKCAN